MTAKERVERAIVLTNEIEERSAVRREVLPSYRFDSKVPDSSQGYSKWLEYELQACDRSGLSPWMIRDKNCDKILRFEEGQLIQLRDALNELFPSD